MEEALDLSFDRLLKMMIRQLHVSAPIGHLQVVFKRTEGPTIYNVRARDGEISTSGFCCVIINYYVQCGGMLCQTPSCRARHRTEHSS